MPLNSRTHILEEFNRGVFDYLIATDAAVDAGDEDDDVEDDDDDVERPDVNDDGDDAESEEGSEDEDENEDEAEENEDDDDEGEDDEDEDEDDEDLEDGDEEGEEDEVEARVVIKKATDKNSKKNRKLVEKDDYGVSRGIDFTNVSFVINFDFPVTTAAYVHRIGRTARGIQSGTALSFALSSPSQTGKLGVTVVKNAEEIASRDRQVLQEVRERQPRLGTVEGDHILNAIGAMDEAMHQTGGNGGSIGTEDISSRMQPAPLVFNMQELESFRYRVEDTLRSVTQASVRELRSAEIRHEILNSEKLKSYFAENPNDLKVLRHDKAILHPIQVKDHLKYVPQYLIPDSMKAVAQVQGKKKRKRSQMNATSDQRLTNGENRMKKSRSRDPLYGGSAGGDNNSSSTGGDGGAGVEKYAQYGASTAGRKNWKLRHKKGEYNPQMVKKQANKTPGTFHKKRK